MYNHSNQSYIHRLKRFGLALMVTGYTLPSAAQYSKDTLLIQFLGSEAAVEEWKSQQKDAYAFDHLLQKKAVAKHYRNKKFGDHLFIEGGFQTLFNATHRNVSGIKNNFYPSAYFGIGDWVTPVHGWRISAQAGNFQHDGSYSKILGGSLDYMMNLTAVAAPEYDQPKRFEIYGIAGFDVVRSEGKKDVDYTWGFHTGLRAQLHFNPYSYLFLEPRAGIYSQDIFHLNTWRKYIVHASAMAGIGYRLNQATRLHNPCHTSGHFLDNTFISFAGGPSDMLNIGGRYGVSKQLGAQAQMSLGKWFNPYSALRLTAGAALRDQPSSTRVKAVQAGIGYMWNMHNTFAGYKRDRRYWVNAVADVHANISTSGKGRQTSFGFGAGLQPNVRIARGVELFLEPRIDVFDKNYASYVGELGRLDFFGSVLAGITFRQGDNSREQIRRNDDFEQKSWYDNLFIEGGVGGIMPISRAAGKDMIKHIGPKLNIGIGKWFNATSGLRLWGEAGQYEEINSEKFKALSVGADYLWNLTNALHGYVYDRPCELIASAGLHTTANLDKSKFFLGGNLGLKGLWHINPMFGLYLEPQLRIYNEDMMRRSSFPIEKIDVLGQLMAGIQLRMNGYRPGTYTEAFADNDRRSFISVAAGLGTNMEAPRNKKQYAVSGRVSYGRWMTPVVAWRVNANGMGRPAEAYRQALGSIGADYMIDLTTLAYGYHPDRIFNVRYFLGTNLGMEYKSKTDGKFHFSADLHTGAQFAFRIGRKNELFAEPVLSYTMGKMPGRSQEERIMLTGFAGITHKLHYNADKKASPADAESNDFVSVSFGSGINTRNAFYSYPRRRRLTIDFDASYGHWFNNVSGIRAGVSGSTLFLNLDENNRQLTTLHADYLLNILALAGGEQALEQPWTLTAVAGLTYNIGSAKNMDNGKGFGFQAGIQGGYKFNKQWELYAEPTVNLMSEEVWSDSGHKFEGLGRFMIGTKYHF